jgi:uncharacterized protein YecE (DUF72 family)
MRCFQGYVNEMIRVGCCGFPVSRKRYFKVFDTVELQQTFYQPPEIKTIKRWRDESPEGFEYTIKAWQLITHEPSSPTYRRLRMKIPLSKHRRYGSFKPTDEVFEAFELMREIANILNAKVIVFQSPPSFEPVEKNRENMRLFFNRIKRDNLLLAWEPRGRWNEKEIKGICDELGLIHVVDPFRTNSQTDRIKYYRLHGIGGYKYRYSDEDLKRLTFIIDIKEDTYVMFNNVYMFDDALCCKEILSAS